jgi:hypothetical protein
MPSHNESLKLLNLKIAMIAKRMHMSSSAFRRFCILDYLYRNKHLIPSKDEFAQLPETIISDRKRLASVANLALINNKSKEKLSEKNDS